MKLDYPLLLDPSDLLALTCAYFKGQHLSCVWLTFGEFKSSNVSFTSIYNLPPLCTFVLILRSFYNEVKGYWKTTLYTYQTAISITRSRVCHANKPGRLIIWKTKIVPILKKLKLEQGGALPLVPHFNIYDKPMIVGDVSTIWADRGWSREAVNTVSWVASELFL